MLSSFRRDARPCVFTLRAVVDFVRLDCEITLSGYDLFPYHEWIS